MTRRPAAEDEHRSNLSTFIPIEFGKDGPYAVVRCPHCEGEVKLNAVRWRQPLMSVIKPDLEIKGRSCPYCMKVSLIPLAFFPKKDRARKAAQRG